MPSSNKLLASGGKVGLYNLRNTCFMNSAIQAISHVEPLTEYFLSSIYPHEINTNNVLGMKGEVPLFYGQLLKDLWSAKYASYISPKAFKYIVGKWCPQFIGDQQQDAQELLAFLLDGLHEGLNRCKQKGTFVNKDSDGRPDTVVAQEFWTNHMLRHQSVIMDLMGAQLKSTLTYQCGRSNVTFDPYTMISVPMPTPRKQSVEMVFVARDPARVPLRIAVEVEDEWCMGDLRMHVSKLLKIPMRRLQFAIISRNYVKKWLLSYMGIPSAQSLAGVPVSAHAIAAQQQKGTKKQTAGAQQAQAQDGKPDAAGDTAGKANSKDKNSAKDKEKEKEGGKGKESGKSDDGDVDEPIDDGCCAPSSSSASAARMRKALARGIPSTALTPGFIAVYELPPAQARQLSTGAKLDVLDTVNKWCIATVMDVRLVSPAAYAREAAHRQRNREHAIYAKQVREWQEVVRYKPDAKPLRPFDEKEQSARLRAFEEARYLLACQLRDEQSAAGLDVCDATDASHCIGLAKGKDGKTLGLKELIALRNQERASRRQAAEAARAEKKAKKRTLSPDGTHTLEDDDDDDDGDDEKGVSEDRDDVDSLAGLSAEEVEARLWEDELTPAYGDVSSASSFSSSTSASTSSSSGSNNNSSNRTPTTGWLRQVLIHYDMWSSKYDEWVDATSSRIAPRGRYTRYVTKRSNNARLYGIMLMK